jgi:hypothetical protein
MNLYRGHQIQCLQSDVKITSSMSLESGAASASAAALREPVVVTASTRHRRTVVALEQTPALVAVRDTVEF